MEQPSPERPAYPIESVDNALRLLLLMESRRAIRVTDASDALNVAPSTAHRLLAMLQYHGLVRQDPATRTYLPGAVLIRLGLSVVRDIDIRQTARPALESLSARLCETVHLAVLQDTNVLFLDCVESTKALRVASREGALLQAHCTSVGKALLAELTPEELRARYLNPSLPQLTQKSMTTRAALERELSTVRERGYAMNSGESEEGVSSVGVAIHDRSGRAIAAISAAAPISRLSKKQAREMARPVQQTAAEIELAAP